MLISRARKLRFRRQLRMRRHQVQELGADTDKHFFRRLDNLVEVRRFTVAWVGLLLILIACSGAQLYSLSSHYQSLRPASGGIYTEGVVGSFTNANPIYASSVADRSVAKLVFSSLLTYNENNQLVGDLAESWTIDKSGQTYTVKLRSGLTWHDGKQLTAEDVAFTYGVIQNPDAQSPLNAGWEGVEVKAVDAQTVTFKLSNPLAPFPHSLTNGIIPKHILASTNPIDLRSSEFNTVNPVGSGPFKWQELTVTGASAESRQEHVTLTAFEDYHHGKPNLSTFNIHVFQGEEQMLKSYKDNELTAIMGLDEEPSDIKDTEINAYRFPQTAAMMTFFKTSSGVLSDKAVRQALVRATDTSAVRKQLTYPVQKVDAPILKDQFGYDSKLTQLGYDPSAAAKLLDEAGWKQTKQGEIRQKGEQKLEFTLYAESSGETARITRQLQEQWRKVGVNARVELQSTSEFQITLSQHSYDALLRGISIGSDPDVFAYWHSSQAEVISGGQLNFSEYESKTADTALEQARTRSDEKLRAAKYEPFLKAWRDDAPALGLYRPELLYISRQSIYGLKNHEINSASDRLSNVHEWKIRRVKTTVD